MLSYAHTLRSASPQHVAVGVVFGDGAVLRAAHKVHGVDACSFSPLRIPAVKSVSSTFSCSFSFFPRGKQKFGIYGMLWDALGCSGMFRIYAA